MATDHVQPQKGLILLFQEEKYLLVAKIEDEFLNTVLGPALLDMYVPSIYFQLTSIGKTTLPIQQLFTPEKCCYL
jgi:hypothetical protein